FILWILFIDNYNIISQYKTYKQIKTLEEKQVFYETEIEKDSIKLYHLKHVKKEQERFAREKFLMKKENEELFIIKQDDGK
ncbi:MAG: septum formation initiator, partial [Bacteroidota bacterium]|nr:septum formation initiator [Bacteroidota bacterium]